ncbi:DoxX family membrane protein [bacterium]|nr:DoxX family membrane protein [bacterium]
MIKNTYIIFIFRLVLGGIFIWSGVMKIMNPLEFAQDIENYRVFPQVLSFFLALILPWIELFCGLFLIIGLFLQASSFLLSVLLFCFLILVGTTILRGIDIQCGCFGALSLKTNYKLFLTDLLLLFFALSIFFSPQTLLGKGK